MNIDFNIPLPLPYTDEISRWKYDDLENCYAYALNIRTNGFRLIPGELAKLDHEANFIYSDNELLWRFKADMKVLGIAVKASSLEERVTFPNSWKIVVMNVKTKNPNLYDFHFMRQDSNGTWHHKFPGEQFPIDYDTLSCKITNPEKAILDFNYHVVGYFILTLKK